MPVPNAVIIALAASLIAASPALDGLRGLTIDLLTMSRWRVFGNEYQAADSQAVVVALDRQAQLDVLRDDDRRFARPCRRDVDPVNQNHFDFGNVTKPRHPVLRKPRIQNLSVCEFDGFKQRSANCHHDRPLNLVPQLFGVHDGTAFKL